jgi:hypothetical protein
MTTKMVVQKKLRELIHPALEVVNVDGTPENTMPEDAYRGPKKEEDETAQAKPQKKHGMLENIKHIVGL